MRDKTLTLSPLPTDTIAVAPQGGSGVTEADVNGATIKAQQSELRIARAHLSHALHCNNRLARKCLPCARAATWVTT